MSVKTFERVKSVEVSPTTGLVCSVCGWGQSWNEAWTVLDGKDVCPRCLPEVEK